MWLRKYVYTKYMEGGTTNYMQKLISPLFTNCRLTDNCCYTVLTRPKYNVIFWSRDRVPAWAMRYMWLSLSVETCALPFTSLVFLNKHDVPYVCSFLINTNIFSLVIIIYYEPDLLRKAFFTDTIFKTAILLRRFKGLWVLVRIHYFQPAVIMKQWVSGKNKGPNV